MLLINCQTYTILRLLLLCTGEDPALVLGMAPVPPPVNDEGPPPPGAPRPPVLPTPPVEVPPSVVDRNHRYEMEEEEEPAEEEPAEPTVREEEEQEDPSMEELVCGLSPHTCFQLEHETFSTYDYIQGKNCSGCNHNIVDSYNGPANAFRCYPCKLMRQDPHDCCYILCADCYDKEAASSSRRGGRRGRIVAV